MTFVRNTNYLLIGLIVGPTIALPSLVFQAEFCLPTLYVYDFHPVYRLLTYSFVHETFVVLSCVMITQLLESAPFSLLVLLGGADIPQHHLGSISFINSLVSCPDIS